VSARQTGAASGGGDVQRTPASRPAIVHRDAYVARTWIGGEARFHVRDPATNELLAQVPDLSDRDVDAAIAAAAAAFPAWRGKPAAFRGEKLAAIAAAMRAG
jgi:acyl-CoA reductase-like NAD-dependent aldehyde dehydrogenase